MTFSTHRPLILAGAGKMGTAMLAGWLSRGVSARHIIVQEPSPSPETLALCEAQGVHITSAAPPVDGGAPAVIVVAVKPQVMSGVWPELAAIAGADTVVMSIAAGIPLSRFTNVSGQPLAVVRAMPNTPAAIGRGITGAVCNTNVTEAQRGVCDGLLRAVGDVVWLDDEALIDAVTAVSGSGPAYVFLLVEALAAAGVDAGLPADQAMRLARVTVSGAGELLQRSPDAADQLRRNVTSPGGTTAAALDVLMQPQSGLSRLMAEAVAAAVRRSQELGK